MRLAIATVGTRGDVQPYIALARQLQARGHTVTMVTHTDHRALVEDHGVAHRGVCGSFRELTSSELGRRWLESGDPIRYMKTFRVLFESVARSWIEDFDAALADADAVLVHAFAGPAITACLAHRKRYALLSPIASLPTRELWVGLPDIPWVGPMLNRFAQSYFLDQFWKVGHREIVAFLQSRGVTPPRKAIWRDHVDRAVPHLYLFSEHVVPKPADWPACSEILGFCFLDAPPEWKPSQRLADFLSAGPPPIYVGFGSMTGMAPEKLAGLTLEALRSARQRAVIGMGWGGLRGIEESDDVLVVDDVPHEWLFPRVSAVVQHCGAGTVAAALRAGRPIVGVPFFGDQPTWARIVHRAGVAPPPVPKRSLTAKSLAAAITATAEPRYATSAARLGEAIRSESASARIADRVLHHFS